MMTHIVLDIENSISKREDGTTDNTPFNPANTLTSVGFKSIADNRVYYFVFNHNQLQVEPKKLQQQKDFLQAILDNAEVLIGHNIKYDLKWLLSCGFTYKGKVWDTMICDYVLLRGAKKGLSLVDCLTRHGIGTTKLGTLDTYYSQGVNTNDIPIDELVAYGKQDVVITQHLYNKQIERIKTLQERGEHYMKIISLMNDFLLVLVSMESSGVALDVELLHKLDIEYGQELSELENVLAIQLQKVMGDRPINLNSTDQLSQLFYSRVVVNKNTWKNIFNIGAEERNGISKKKRLKIYSNKEFNNIVRNNMEVVYKTTAHRCTTCHGKGTIQRIKKDGSNYKKPTTCKACNGIGVEQKLTTEVAGLKLTPLNSNATAGGFACSSDEIEYYLTHPRTSQEAKYVLGLLQRYAKLTTWKNTFIAQLLKFKHGDILHANFNQTITATGRLSSSAPNLQNQPARDPEFKIKKAFISRWKDIGGLITDADFSQLEFRIAALLSQCPKAILAVEQGLDIHSLTRDFYHGKLDIKPSIIQPNMTRQEAKAHTFGPLYGKVTEWTEQFYLLFPGIKAWHDKIMTEVVETGELWSPSGRIYAFPNTRWFMNNKGERTATGHTQIKNYTVQGFATGDMVLLVLIDIHNYLTERNAKSRLILQVHDSVATDTHPDEVQLVEDAYKFAFDNVYAHAKERFGIDINVPLAFELSRGPSWGEQTKINFN